LLKVTMRAEPHYGIWFNNRRLLEPIGNIPPAEAEERYYATLDAPAGAAKLKRNGLRQTRCGSLDAFARSNFYLRHCREGP
jgi:hypothetical protein